MARFFLPKSNYFAVKKYRILQLLFLVFNTVVLFCYKADNNSGESDERKVALKNESTGIISQRGSVKSILLWNAPQRAEVISFGTGREVFQLHRCQVDACEIVVSRYQFPERPLDSYDAIVINLNDQMWLYELPNSDLDGRKPHQRYVFFTQEPPSALEEYEDVYFADNYYNWTMTYRRNSDIPFIYGRIEPRNSSLITQEQVSELIRQAGGVNRAHRKTKLVAWMVSHCTTAGRREEYVEQLKRYIKVDIYGDCGNLKCKRHELFSSDLTCYDIIESSYKFYFSFENAICKDYVTEKLFNIMSRNIVPIVYGGADYENIAPPHSYIDARKFEPRHLADYLTKLDANDTLYNEYFWWKDHYTVEYGITQMAKHGFCHLCQKLHQDNDFKTYTKLSALWKHKEECSSNLSLSQL